MWTLPNLLTLARIVAVVPLVALIQAGWWPGAFALFGGAAVTDWLDGYIAQRWNQQSDLGRMLDPIADKLIVAAVLVAMIAAGSEGWTALAARGHADTGEMLEGPAGARTWTPSTWATIAIVTRELAVAGVREFLGPKGVIMRVSALAKWKTATQLGALALLLLSATLWTYRPTGSWYAAGTGTAGRVLLIVSAVLAWITAVSYLRVGLRHMEPQR